MGWLRRLWAGLRHDLSRRGSPEQEGYLPAFDPTVPRGLATYGDDGEPDAR